MLNLDATDVLEGIASTTNVVEFTFSGVDGTTVVSREGKLTNAQTEIYTATAATRLLSLTLVNTHSAAVTVNIQKDPTDAGTLYRVIPKDLSLGIGYSIHFDGQRCTVMDPTGAIVATGSVSDTAYDEGTWNGVTAIAPSKNAVRDEFELRAPKATPTFTGQATIPTINLTGGQIVFPASQAASGGANTLDDYEEGTYTATLTCGTSGTITLNSGANLLAYTKMGNYVYITGQLLVDSVSSPVGSLTLNLPFTIADMAEQAAFFAASAQYTDINALGAAGALCIFGNENTASVTIREQTTTTNLNDVANHIKAGSYLRFNFSFFV